MTIARYLLLIFFQTIVLICHGQTGLPVLSGTVTDAQNKPLSGVSVTILGRQTGTSTSDSGTFQLRVPAGRTFAVVFSSTGYRSVQRNFLLKERQKQYIDIRLEHEEGNLDSVVITDQQQRREAGLISINPKAAANLPSPVGGIESLIKIFVGSNNELTSQYTVRGGNYDENLIYVN
ncbi:MAG TPA: carboxypeptidase-like regulatory domain-containing protein, partial [Flavitalea sp.]|nr:carboxypeptidase-like regulatory domain-containing protein [Flavitalea sp.]